MTSRKLASIAAVIMLVLSVIGVPFIAQETAAPVAQAQEVGPKFGANQQCVENQQGPQRLKGLGILLDVSYSALITRHFDDINLSNIYRQLRTMVYEYSQQGGDFVSIYIYDENSPTPFANNANWETQLSDIRNEKLNDQEIQTQWEKFDENFFTESPRTGRYPPSIYHNYSAAMQRIAEDQENGWFYTDVVNLPFNPMTDSVGTPKNNSGKEDVTRIIDFDNYMAWKGRVEDNGAFIQTIGVGDAFWVRLPMYNVKYGNEDASWTVNPGGRPVNNREFLRVVSTEGAGAAGKATEFLPYLRGYQATGEDLGSGFENGFRGGFPGLERNNTTCLTLTVGKDDGQGNISLDKSNRTFEVGTSVRTTFTEAEKDKYSVEATGGFANMLLSKTNQRIRTTLPPVDDDYESTDMPVCYASMDGMTWEKLDVGKDSTPTQLDVELPAAANVNCQFTVRKTTTVTLQKDVVGDQNIQNELDSDRYGQYHFAYECVDEASGFEVSGLFSPVRRNRYDADNNLIPPLAGDMQLPAAIPADPNNPTGAAARIPVGATCTVTELQPRVSEGYFSHVTTWIADTDGEFNSGTTDTFPFPSVTESQPVGECGLTSCERKKVERDTTIEKKNPTATFVVEPEQGKQGVTVRATNNYKSPKTLLMASVQVTNPDELGKDMPANVDITYSCRYIPSADKRPEIAANPEQYPVVVGSGVQSVPVSADGTAEARLGEFPVGTQCEVNTIAPDKKKDSPLIPGYSYTTDWYSRSCMKQDPSDPGYTAEPRKCGSNYTYAYFGDEVETTIVNGAPMDVHRVRAALTFSRKERVLEVTKRLEGKARQEALSKEFSATLTCMDTKYPGVTTKDDKLTLVPGTTKRIPVPVRSSCTVTEDDPNTEDSLLQITPPDPVTVEVTDDSIASIPVDITNTVEDRYASFTWTYTVRIGDVEDPTTLGQLQSLPMDFKSICTLPNNERFETTFTGVLPNESFSIGIPADAAVSDRWERNGKLPYGTTCRTTYVRPDLTGIEAQVRPSGTETDLGSEITVSSDAGHNALVSFERKTAAVRVNVNHTRPNIPDIHVYLPLEYDVDISCRENGIGKYSNSGKATAAEPWVDFRGVPEGMDCTVTVKDPANSKWQEAFTRTTKITTGPPANITVSVPPASGDTPGVVVSESADKHAVMFTAQMKVGDGAAQLDVTHDYVPITQKMTVEKKLTVTDTEGNPVTDQKLIDAVLGTNEEWVIMAHCTRNNMPVERGGTIRPGQPAEFTVPVGADCYVTEEAETYRGVDGPTITYNGEAEAKPYRVTQGEDHTITVDNAYKVQFGSINMKKKVDGTGVQTVNGARKFKVAYTCKLGDWEKSGHFESTRFDAAKGDSITGIPVGAECTYTEDTASSRNPEDTSGPNNTGDPAKELDAYYSHWETRWNVSPDEEGFGTEQLCSGLPNCTVSGDHEAQATFTIAKNGFNGTMILWNTYNYTKVPLVLEKKLAGDGPRLQNGGLVDQVMVDYSCTHPAWALSDLKEKPFIPDPTISGTVVFDRGEGVKEVGTYIPGNFVCTVTEHPVDTFGGTVTVGYEGLAEDNSTVTTFTPKPESGMRNNKLQFTVDRDLAANSEKKLLPNGADEWVSTGTQHLTLTNTYERPRASLTASFGIDTGMEGDVSPWINDPDGGIELVGECADPDVPEVKDPIRGTVSQDGEVRLHEDGADLIAGSECTFTSTAKDKAQDPIIDVTETYTQSAGDPLEPLGTLEKPRLLPLKTGQNKVDVRASYVVPQLHLSLTKDVVGDDEKKIFGDEDRIPLGYRCDFQNLIGEEPAPFDPEGSFDLTRGGTWSQTVPTGSSCTVTENSPTPEVADKITAAGVQMSPYTIRGEDKVPTSEATLNVESPQVILVNAIYRDDAEVQVQKIQADLKTALKGSWFAIFQATETGMSEEPVATMTSAEGKAGEPSSTFTARLKPGTYYLVETKAPEGAALLPGAWKFDVVGKTNPEKDFVDLEIELAAQTSDSGLVSITTAEPEKGKPAIIQVANILQGKLPLTGSYGVFWWILGGFVLIGAGFAWKRRS